MTDFNVDAIIEKLELMPPPVLDKSDIFKVLDLSKELLIKEENVLELSDPIIICGDVHGQLYDVLEIFRIEPPPPDSQYLFLGDYVDRGYYSFEVLMYLLCLKIRSPDRVYLLRGNHESITISHTYGFYQECLEKFTDSSVYLRCAEVFNYLPIAAMINNRIFCCHGGLSPSIHLVEQIHTIDRFMEPMTDGPLTDLLWGDPNEALSGFKVSNRGTGYLFGGNVTKRFAHLNRISLICRAHQLAENGYQMCFDNLLATVWSAPNYMYRSGNLASVMRLANENDSFQMTFNIFDAVPASERTVPERTEAISNYFS